MIYFILVFASLILLAIPFLPSSQKKKQRQQYSMSELTCILEKRIAYLDTL